DATDSIPISPKFKRNLWHRYLNDVNDNNESKILSEIDCQPCKNRDINYTDNNSLKNKISFLSNKLYFRNNGDESHSDAESANKCNKVFHTKNSNVYLLPYHDTMLFKTKDNRKDEYIIRNTTPTQSTQNTVSQHLNVLNINQKNEESKSCFRSKRRLQMSHPYMKQNQAYSRGADRSLDEMDAAYSLMNLFNRSS
ncbi:hypothetical protein Anas_12286, partial [Armadillidium nasatum]